MANWYQTYVAGTGRSAALWALIGFLVTYGLTRWITRRIRAHGTGQARQGRSAVRDVYIGGVHIHHQVWGILLVPLAVAGGPGRALRRRSGADAE